MEFSTSSTCSEVLGLSPNQMSACSVQVAFGSTLNGTYNDVLSIQSDAINGVNGNVSILLSASQVSTPAPPELVVTSLDEDAHLYWAPVDTSIAGCLLTTERYLVFYSPNSTGTFYYHGWTADTHYVHTGVVTYADAQFYRVVAVDLPSLLLDEIAVGLEMDAAMDAVRKLYTGTQKRRRIACRPTLVFELLW